jgi:signal peptidase II
MLVLEHDDNFDETGGTMKIRALILSIMLIAADRVSKLLAAAYLKPIGDLPIIDGVFHLSFLENEGAAFGMLPGARWFFVPLTVIVCAVIVFLYLKLPPDKAKGPFGLSLIMIFGGAVGNFIDRLLYGSVVDFLYFKLIDFAVFNLADTFLVLGTIFLAVLMIFFPSKTELKWKR